MKSLRLPFITVAAVCATAFMLGACRENHPQTQPALPEAASALSEPILADTAHTAENALDWAGTYQGKLPCDSCDYIDTTLILKPDQTYILTEDYQSGKTSLTNRGTGRFEWEANGTVIRTKPDEATVAQNERRYFVAEGHVLQLPDGESSYQENSPYRLEQKSEP